jgi:hypothetical protein
VALAVKHELSADFVRGEALAFSALRFRSQVENEN